VALEFARPERVTSSRAVSKQPCFIQTLIVTGKGGGTGILTVRNGPTSDSEIIAKFQVAVAESRPFNFGQGLYLNRGCYIELNDYVEEALVLIKEI